MRRVALGGMSPRRAFPLPAHNHPALPVAEPDSLSLSPDSLPATSPPTVTVRTLPLQFQSQSR
jgi:hypothetical protein